MMNKLLLISLIVNLIFLAVIGYLLFDAGVLKARNELLTIQNQVNQNTKNIQDIINFLNQNTQK